MFWKADIESNFAPSDLQTSLPLRVFSPLANGLYLIVIINKTLLRNGNCPIMNHITEMGVAHIVGLECGMLLWWMAE